MPSDGWRLFREFANFVKDALQLISHNRQTGLQRCQRGRPKPWRTTECNVVLDRNIREFAKQQDLVILVLPYFQTFSCGLRIAR